MNLIRFFINQPVLVNIIVVAAIATGILTIGKIPQESYPSINFGMIPISTSYPGAPPEEVEKLITRKIEDAVWDQPDIDYIQSTSIEGFSTIRIQLKDRLTARQIDDAYTDVQQRVTRINDFPEAAKLPVVSQANPALFHAIVDIVLSGPYNDLELQGIAEKLKDRLQSSKGVGKVTIASSGTGRRGSDIGQMRQVWVEINPVLLEQYSLTQSDIVNALKTENLNMASGDIESGKQDYIIRVMGEYTLSDQIKEVIVKGFPDGSVIRIKDIAKVTYRLEEKIVYTRESYKKALILRLYMQEDANVIKVVDEAKTVSNDFNTSYPELRITFRNNSADEVKKVIGILVDNIYIGMLLVAIALFLLLGWRNAGFATFAVPFAYLATFILMYYFDITFNSYTLFALLMASGMLVDNAIVIIDNISRYLKEHYTPKEAAIIGAEEVVWPITASTLTTVVAFMPLLLMTGGFGRMLAVFPVVVSISLVISLLQALFSLPLQIATFTHTATQKPRDDKPWGKKMWFFMIIFSPFIIPFWLIKFIWRYVKLSLDWLEHMFTRPSERGFKRITRIYQNLLIKVLEYRYIAIASIFLFSLIVGYSIRYIDIQLFTEIERDYLVLQFDLPVGTKLAYTDSIARIVEKHLSTYPSTEIKTTVVFVGYKEGVGAASTSSNLCQINIDLPEKEKRTIKNEQLMAKVRSFMKTLTMLGRYEFYDRPDGPPPGKPVEVSIIGDDLDKLKAYSEEMRTFLAQQEGIVDLTTSYNDGIMELRVFPSPERLKIYGLNHTEVAMAVRDAINGIKPGTPGSFFTKDNEEVEILIRYDQGYVKDLDAVKSLRIPTKTGQYVTLSDVADIKTIRGPASIDHYNKTRRISVRANVQGSMTSDKANRLLVEKYKDFETLNPGYRLKYGGRAEEQKKSFESLAQAFVIALLLIFGILGTQFKNYLQPLTVLVTVPFAFVGVVLGLHISGLPISLNALISIIALAGVVVNNAIILVDFINQARNKGLDRWDSIISAGGLRIRPILLTTITTLSGLIPMALNLGGTNETFQPMAVCFSWGLSFATFLTLFMVPALVAILDDLATRRGNIPDEQKKTFEEFKQEYTAKRPTGEYKESIDGDIK